MRVHATQQVPLQTQHTGAEPYSEVPVDGSIQDRFGKLFGCHIEQPRRECRPLHRALQRAMHGPGAGLW